MPKYKVDDNGQLDTKYLKLVPYKSFVNLTAPTRGYSDPLTCVVIEVTLERSPATETQPAEAWIEVTLADYDADIDLDDLKVIPPLKPAKLDSGAITTVPTPQDVLLTQIPGNTVCKADI